MIIKSNKLSLRLQRSTPRVTGQFHNCLEMHVTAITYKCYIFKIYIATLGNSCRNPLSQQITSSLHSYLLFSLLGLCSASKIVKPWLSSPLNFLHHSTPALAFGPKFSGLPSLQTPWLNQLSLSLTSSNPLGLPHWCMPGLLLALGIVGTLLLLLGLWTGLYFKGEDEL